MFGDTPILGFESYAVKIYTTKFVIVLCFPKCYDLRSYNYHIYSLYLFIMQFYFYSD